LPRRAFAGAVGLSKSAFYYVSRQAPKDWAVKVRIEELLREQPGYGYRRVAIALRVNKKRAQRVMQLFGIKAYRRRGRRFRRARLTLTKRYPNLLLGVLPGFPNHVWVSDFTELAWRGRKLFLCTVLDLWSREVVGWSLLTSHSAVLVLQALCMGLLHRPRPAIFHSDNGRENDARVVTGLLTKVGTAISRIHPGCPWENGYQEGFYSPFKTELGDPNRFRTLGELVAEVHRLLYAYNTTRIHSALKMPPRVFAERTANRMAGVRAVEKVS
jgi:putative transposase